MTRVAFLWHHHQPDYRSPETGRPQMPWVRLHALRGYRDMAVWALESELEVTINVVPSLLSQLGWYAGGGGDPQLDRCLRPAASVDPAVRPALARGLFGGHPALWRVHPAASRLRALTEAGELHREQDFRDLQVWANLAWVGWSGLRDEPALAEARARGSGFTEEQKAEVLAACDRLLVSVLPLHRRLVAEGVAEISASPANHPILPLLIDTEFARRSLPDLPPEIPAFRYPEDALIQLRLGRQRVMEVLGAEVAGLWPSEGSVCPELLPLVAQAGFRWLATDEGNLLRSERDEGTRDGPWDLGEGLRGFFRDRELSDAIGFRAAGRPPALAVEELVEALEGRGGVVTIALDGENPWESFEDAGQGFLSCLTEALRGREGLSLTTLSEAAEDPPVGRVRRLHTGSWINADLGIWFGDAEDREGWARLSEARAAVKAAGDPPEAMEHLLAAEGSDWFWWYGTDFTTPFAPVFDRLFREHLAAAWRALGEPPPANLRAPIKAPGHHGDPLAPSGLIRPDPERSPPRLLEWAPAGELDCAASGGAMARGTDHLDRIGWGCTEDALLLRLDLRRPAPPEPAGTHWRVEVDGVEARSWPHGFRGRRGGWLFATGAHAVVSLPRPAPEATFRVTLERGGVALVSYPPGRPLTVGPRAEDWWV